MNSNLTKDDPFDYELKILLLGDQAVGKTSLIVNYIDKTFYSNMIGTAGIDFKKKVIIINDKKIKVNIFDTAGQERFRNIAKNLYRNTNGIMLVYDVTDVKSKDSVLMWTETIKKNVENDIEVLLIGNKIDLIDERKISYEEGECISKDFNYPFIETSAKTGKNVNEAFLRVINNIVNKMMIKHPKTLETEANIILTNREIADRIPLNKQSDENIKLSNADVNRRNKKLNSVSCCCK